MKVNFTSAGNVREDFHPHTGESTGDVAVFKNVIFRGSVSRVCPGSCMYRVRVSFWLCVAS